MCPPTTFQGVPTKILTLYTWNIATCKWWFPFILVVSLYFGVEKATCFKWLQHGDLLRSPVQPKKEFLAIHSARPSANDNPLLRGRRAEAEVRRQEEVPALGCPDGAGQRPPGVRGEEKGRSKKWAGLWSTQVFCGPKRLLQNRVCEAIYIYI